jgi:hypothetical protein
MIMTKLIDNENMNAVAEEVKEKMQRVLKAI